MCSGWRRWRSVRWKQGPAHCILCGHEHTAVAPVDVVVPFECANCGEIVAIWSEDDLETTT